IFYKTVQKIGRVFHAPRPTPLLAVDVFHSPPERGSDIRIHRDRIKERLDPKIAVVMQKNLPENTGVFGEHVSRTKTDIEERLKGYRLRGKRSEPLGPRLVHHLPESGREGNHPRERRGLINIIREKRNRLVDRPPWGFGVQEYVGKAAKVFGEGL